MGNTSAPGNLGVILGLAIHHQAEVGLWEVVVDAVPLDVVVRLACVKEELKYSVAASTMVATISTYMRVPGNHFPLQPCLLERLGERMGVYTTVATYMKVPGNLFPFQPRLHPVRQQVCISMVPSPITRSIWVRQEP